ncbi:hypothetical protein [Ramlibacter rhizophilus]|uniref:Periplasmic heavy metal sensor n=1 Tax=Ramlibacter rhizophilus TaxID=1781167 RepID=A0A4Z0C0E8_9BURK|nr:hypothetical protein [Ramlibacter rhizophilus]TFZ04681.1 hypothetical protein EZ242_02730 [Ramlibacter rhizophilus]
MERALSAILTAAAVMAAGCSAPQAAGPGPQARIGPAVMGPGVMAPGMGPGGMGPGVMGAYGPGYGMGAGMMAGPGGGMGPGMMGGPSGGMGPGMMGGGGPGLDAIAATLSEDQRKRMAAIQQDLAQRQWPLMERAQQLMGAGGGAASEQQERGNYDALAALHRQMFENSLQARRQMEEVLTPEQREHWRRSRGAGRPGAPG